MSFEIVPSERSSAEVAAIFDYLIEHLPVSVDTVCLGNIISRIEQLSHRPHVGDIVHRIRGRDIRVCNSGDYSIFFSVDDASQRVHILSIRHIHRHDSEFPE